MSQQGSLHGVSSFTFATEATLFKSYIATSYRNRRNDARWVSLNTFYFFHIYILSYNHINHAKKGLGQKFLNLIIVGFIEPCLVYAIVYRVH